MTKVFAQMENDSAPPLCARPGDAIFPPRDQIVDFRRRLEASHPTPTESTKSAVDLEGEAVWLQEYLQRRVAGCAHVDATDDVRNEILGATTRRRCAQ